MLEQSVQQFQNIISADMTSMEKTMQIQYIENRSIAMLSNVHVPDFHTLHWICNVKEFIHTVAHMCSNMVVMGQFNDMGRKVSRVEDAIQSCGGNPAIKQMMREVSMLLLFIHGICVNSSPHASFLMLFRYLIVADD